VKVSFARFVAVPNRILYSVGVNLNPARMKSRTASYSSNSRAHNRDIIDLALSDKMATTVSHANLQVLQTYETLPPNFRKIEEFQTRLMAQGSIPAVGPYHIS